MKLFKLIIFTFASFYSLFAYSKEIIPPTVPTWLTCKLQPDSYAFNETLFISLPNKQIWGVYKSYSTVEAIGVMGLGLTRHKVTYSTKNRIGISAAATHSLNGSVDGHSFSRYAINLTFNQLEVVDVDFRDGVIFRTPDVSYYSCKASGKPQLITSYEEKYLKKGYLERRLKNQ
jgi:hypothetical protein